MSEPVTVDIAAGGLLEHRTGDELHIAVVYRPKHDDWTLPKGHLDPGETLEQAALREVEEETGCHGEIIEIVQPNAYLVKKRPKIVVYYRIKLVGSPDFTPNDEVSEMLWLTPGEAVDKLTYQVDRDLVSRTYLG